MSLYVRRDARPTQMPLKIYNLTNIGIRPTELFARKARPIRQTANLSRRDAMMSRPTFGLRISSRTNAGTRYSRRGSANGRSFANASRDSPWGGGQSHILTYFSSCRLSHVLETSIFLSSPSPFYSTIKRSLSAPCPKFEPEEKDSLKL